MYEVYKPIYIKGRFHNPGDTFDAPEAQVASFLRDGFIGYVKESHEKAAKKSAPPVEKTPVAVAEEPPVEETAETTPAEPVKKKSTRKPSATKVSEEE